MDYREYLRLREAEEDRDDYYTALDTKITNKKWIKHDTIKKELSGLRPDWSGRGLFTIPLIL